MRLLVLPLAFVLLIAGCSREREEAAPRPGPPPAPRETPSIVVASSHGKRATALRGNTCAVGGLCTEVGFAPSRGAIPIHRGGTVGIRTSVAAQAVSGMLVWVRPSRERYRARRAATPADDTGQRWVLRLPRNVKGATHLQVEVRHRDPSYAISLFRIDMTIHVHRPGRGSPPAVSAAGPGLSVSDALVSVAEGPLLVRGVLYEREGEIRLCEALAESYPPQCGGAWLVVQGMSLSDVEGVQTAEGVSWTNTEVKLLGEIEKGTLVVSDTAQA